MANRALHDNAVAARLDQTSVRRAAVVTGDDFERRFWLRCLGQHPESADPEGSAVVVPDSGPLVLVENGKRGNLFGTLTAYSDIRVNRADSGAAQMVDQIIMLLGTGSRLSPFTQALRNIKAAFPLPNVDVPGTGFTIGEAAIRAGSPLVSYLNSKKFRGILVRWGDEILIPSADFRQDVVTYLDADVVRFGWRADPNEQLAAQKEWLLVDQATGNVVSEISRQPLASLRQEIARRSPQSLTPYVNLGSFAASPAFLDALADVFGPQLSKVEISANWDPYFWIAFFSDSERDWDRAVQAEISMKRTGIEDLLSQVPDFFSLVTSARRRLEEQTGRTAQIRILDFGEPYWIDAGDHAGLHRMYEDIFRDTPGGMTVRSFFGLPDSLARGGSVVRNSSIHQDVEVANSLVIGSRIRHPSSRLERAVVLGGDYGLLRISEGGVAIQSISDELTLLGPAAVAFRLEQSPAVLESGESRSTILTSDGTFQMRYLSALGTISRSDYELPVAGNAVSYRALAESLALVDPLAVDAYWKRQGSPPAS